MPNPKKPDSGTPNVAPKPQRRKRRPKQVFDGSDHNSFKKELEALCDGKYGKAKFLKELFPDLKKALDLGYSYKELAVIGSKITKKNITSSDVKRALEESQGKQLSSTVPQSESPKPATKSMAKQPEHSPTITPTITNSNPTAVNLKTPSPGHHEDGSRQKYTPNTRN
jgi:hypothetical protein